MALKFPVPECLIGKCKQEDYTHWLYGKAAAHVRRDKKRGNTICTTEMYRQAIHEAVTNGGDCDFYTGEKLRWNLIRTYDNEESKKGRRNYKRQFSQLPTVDHEDDGLGNPNFVICAWKTNDCKNDLSVEDLRKFCEVFLAYQNNKPNS